MPLASHVRGSSSPGTTSDHRSCTKLVWHQFSRQYTPGHRTIFSLRFAIGIFMSMCLFFLVGGGIFLSYSLAQVQLQIAYSDAAPLSTFSTEERSLLMQGQTVGNLSQTAQPITSQIDVEVEQDMDSPIHIYYVLHDFYQSHKRYVRSVSYAQMHGINMSASELNACKPQLYLNNASAQAVNRRLITPCGLAAWSFFNDTFSNFKVLPFNGPNMLEPIDVDSSTLAWETDRDVFYGDVEPANHNTLEAHRGGRALEVPLNKDEHFMVWMRVSAHPDVRKFYGIIYRELKKGDRLQLTVTHQFNTYGFKGTKELLITTSGPFGNRNLTFGIAWLAMGGLSCLITFIYISLGWHQLWNTDRRIEDLQLRWLRGTRDRAASSIYMSSGRTNGISGKLL